MDHIYRYIYIYISILESSLTLMYVDLESGPLQANGLVCWIKPNPVDRHHLQRREGLYRLSWSWASELSK